MKQFFIAIGFATAVLSQLAACSSCYTGKVRKQEISIAEPCQNNSFEIDDVKRGFARVITQLKLGHKDATNGKCRNPQKALKQAGYECKEQECDYAYETYNLGYEGVVEKLCTPEAAKQAGIDDAKKGITEDICFKLRICPNFQSLKTNCLEGYKDGK